MNSYVYHYTVLQVKTKEKEDYKIYQHSHTASFAFLSINRTINNRKKVCDSKFDWFIRYTSSYFRRDTYCIQIPTTSSLPAPHYSSWLNFKLLCEVQSKTEFDDFFCLEWFFKFIISSAATCSFPQYSNMIGRYHNNNIIMLVRSVPVPTFES